MASLKKQMQVIQKLIKLKRLDEARDVLMTINHTKAKALLKKLNKQSPEKDRYVPVDDDDADRPTPAEEVTVSAAGSPNFVFIFVSLLVLLVIMAGGVYAANEPVQPLMRSVSVVDDGCGAQTWYNRVAGVFADSIAFSPFMLIYVDSDQIAVNPELQQDVIARFNSRISALENTEVPPCMAAAQAHLLAAAQAGALAAERFNNTDPGRSFYQIGVMLDETIAAADELQAQNVTFFGQEEFAVQMLTDEQCPAYEWAMRQMYTDNQFILMIMVYDDVFEGSNLMASVQNYITSLRQQHVTLKYANAPACVSMAKIHLVDAIDAFAMIFEAAIGGDTYGMNLHNETMLQSLGWFYDELENQGLDPYHFGRGYILGY